MNEFNKSIEKLFKDAKAIGARLIVSSPDKILENITYGLANKEENIEVIEETKFRIASISKTVLALGLMKLVEEGKINLESDISYYLGYKVRNPYFPDDIITVKMLTLQTSSILDGYDDEIAEYDNYIKGYNGLNRTILDVSLEELLTDCNSIYYTEKTFGNYKPGTNFNYSNFGCGIMACIIEKVSGMYYNDYMKEVLFKPLGIDASFRSSLLKDHYNIASMYSGKRKYDKNNFINSKLPIFNLGNNYRGPAGGLFISITDLNKILRLFLNYGTLNNQKILQRETIEYMYQIHYLVFDNDSYKAKGIQLKVIDYFKNCLFRGHTGGAYGVRSFLYFNLKEKIGACFITNGMLIENESKVCNEIFFNIMNIIKDKYIRQTRNIVIIKEKEIHLEDRLIKDENLLKDNLIKVTTLADILNNLFTFNNHTLEVCLNYNNKQLTTKAIFFDNDFYLNIYDIINYFEIEFEKKNNNLYLLV